MHTNIAWEEHHGRGRLTRVLHVIAQRRPRAHFRAGDDTAELAILPPPRDRDRSRVGALYVGNLSVLGGLSHNNIVLDSADSKSLIPLSFLADAPAACDAASEPVQVASLVLFRQRCME